LQSIFNGLGFPIRKSRDQFIFANPPSLSQLITSFIASESQGIPRVPFLTFFYAYSFCSIGYVFMFVRCLYLVSSHRYQVSRLSSYYLLLCTCYSILTTSFTVVFSFTITSSNMSKNFFVRVKNPEPGTKTIAYLYILYSILLPPLRSVENNGFEPLTPCVQGRCSSQLS
jgi:hypothetical protein